MFDNMPNRNICISQSEHIIQHKRNELYSTKNIRRKTEMKKTGKITASFLYL